MKYLYEVFYVDLLGNEGSFVAGGDTVEDVVKMTNRTLQQNNWTYKHQNWLRGKTGD